MANPEWSLAIVTATGGGVAGFWRWLTTRNPATEIPPSVDPSFPFEVVKPHSRNALRVLMGSAQAEDDPLADFNIPYQPRRSDFSVRQQLEGLLDVHRWLLILGRTGLGKTREAAELASRLNNEGWTVLKLKNHELLTVPTHFPAKMLGQQPRLLFFLDNLNQAMSLSNVEANDSQPDKLPSALKQPLQERLKETIEFFEQNCGSDRVKVVATARNETVSEKPGLPSEWDKLKIEAYPKFWRSFHHHELQEPAPKAIVDVLAQTTQNANLSSHPEDFDLIARCNDGTFRNVVENLEIAKNRRQTVALANYKQSLTGTWQSRYRAAVARDKCSKAIYDAIDLLRQCDVELHDFTVLATAAVLSGKTKIWQVWPRWKLRKSLEQLNGSERILQPRDGQIEGKGYAIDSNDYFSRVEQLLVSLSKKHPDALVNSLYGFISAAISARRYPQALSPANRLVHLLPKSDTAWFNKAFLLSALGRYEAAIAAYDQALTIKPDLHEALTNKGVALAALGRYEEAIAAYDQALTIKPDDHAALYNKACCYALQGEVMHAIQWLQDAINLAPEYRDKAKTDTDFDSIRHDERFQALVEGE